MKLMTMRERINDLKLVHQDLEEFHLRGSLPSVVTYRLLDGVIIDMELAYRRSLEKVKKSHAGRRKTQ